MSDGEVSRTTEALVYLASLAWDAMQYGLEECERLRADVARLYGLLDSQLDAAEEVHRRELAAMETERDAARLQLEQLRGCIDALRAERATEHAAAVKVAAERDQARMQLLEARQAIAEFVAERDRLQAFANKLARESDHYIARCDAGLAAARALRELCGPIIDEPFDEAVDAVVDALTAKDGT